MIEDAFVIDAVTHCLVYDWPAFKEMSPAEQEVFQRYMWEQLHLGLSSRDSEYILTLEQFNRNRSYEEYAYSLFAESHTDIAVFHSLPWGTLHPAMASPLETVRASEEFAPGRHLSYLGVSPVDTQRAKDQLDAAIDEYGVIGLKLYPGFFDFDLRVVRPFRLDDEELAYPLIQHAQDRGIRTIAIHKAVGTSLPGMGVGDLEKPASAFPKMNFEIVHGGVAFLEETCFLAQLPNVWVNLEATSGYLHFAPRRFAEIIGRLCQSPTGGPNAADRIIWATGATWVHPRPFVEKFWNFTMPEDLVNDYGYIELTSEVKRKILAENYCRMHGLDLETLKARIPNDEMRQRQLAGDLDKPWSRTPVVT